MRSITIIRPGALGDTLLTLPALGLLRAWAPETRVTLIARADVLPLALASALTDSAWPWDLPDWSALYDADATIERLTDRARAAIVDAYAVIAWTSGQSDALAASLIRLGARRPLVARALPPDGATVEHTAVWLARSVAAYSERAPITGLDAPAALWQTLPPLRWPADAGVEAERRWRALGLPDSGVVALHPGSGGAAKRWAPEGFAALVGAARAAGLTPLLLAGEADEAAVAAVLANLALPAPVARGLDISALAALLARCVGYVGADSGVSHLAGMLGVPTVALFGPTDPTRWAPLGPRITALRAPEGDLTRLRPEQVWDAFLIATGR